MVISEKELMGYEFEDDKTYDQAKREINNLEKIEKNVNIRSKGKQLEFYNKLIEEEIFVTPIGIEYLRKLQKELRETDEINQEEIRAIPVDLHVRRVSEPVDDRALRRAERRADKYKERCTKLWIVNLVLVLLISAMLIISKKSEKYDLDYYRESVENEYINWENNLKERESELQKREEQLP